jgi:hypothetical protein
MNISIGNIVKMTEIAEAAMAIFPKIGTAPTLEETINPYIIGIIVNNDGRRPKKNKKIMLKMKAINISVLIVCSLLVMFVILVPSPNRGINKIA